MESRQRSSSKGPSTLSNPSVTAFGRASSLCTREPLGTGDADCHVGPLGLLAMTTVFCHSEASAHTGRGNPSFLRWTGVRAAEVVGPCGRSTEVPAMGRCRHRPLRKAQSTTQASRRAVKRPRPRGRGMGGNRRKDHPKRGTAAATARAALSEAESAEREAGQIRSLPDDLRVQHGVPCPEVSAQLRPCSRRGCGN